ncbi:hypothetical protein PTTG_29844 [Puccinia triticina 1-1 BBBD Race 1]|uniref:Uncharacterized protein n=1 Tax=Puccinia triticina (isolate 1-1 / race 1 (BBBD)) TaxID=630390 RepID=A0A180G3Y9_PUCT1|nr:hypothetical protein PTTG_29844 [Puccinia triticina 1-1 BBBD Race 1]
MDKTSEDQAFVEVHRFGWKFVILLHPKTCKVDYVLKATDSKACPATWTDDNIAVCSVIAKTINLANLCYIQDFGEDAAGMWESLAKAHQSLASRNCIYWLQRLLLARMLGDDIEPHLIKMRGHFDQLKALITTEKPLTADNIYAASLIISLPDDWMPCVASILNNTTLFCQGRCHTQGRISTPKESHG